MCPACSNLPQVHKIFQFAMVNEYLVNIEYRENISLSGTEVVGKLNCLLEICNWFTSFNL